MGAIFMVAGCGERDRTLCHALARIERLVLGLAQLTPVGFLTSLIMLPWAIAAGVTLARRPHDRQVAIRVGASPGPG
jgi:hypothetical protein